MKNQNLFNRKSLKFFRSSLGNKSTSAEVELWNVIELDGNPHGEYHKIEKDKKRDQYLEGLGFSILSNQPPRPESAFV